MFCLHPRNSRVLAADWIREKHYGKCHSAKTWSPRRLRNRDEMRDDKSVGADVRWPCDEGWFSGPGHRSFSRGVSQAWLNRGHVVHCAALWLVNQCRVLSRPCAKQNIISQGGMYQYTYTGLLVKVTWTLPRRVIGTVLLYANLGVYGGTTAETFGTNWGTWISKIKTLMAMIVVQNGHPLCRK